MQLEINVIIFTLVLCVLYAYAAGAIIISEELKNFLQPSQQNRALFSVPRTLIPAWLLSVSFPLCITGAYLLPGSTNMLREYGLIGLMLQILYSYLAIPVVVHMFQRLQKQLPCCPASLVQYVYWRYGMGSGLVFNLLSIFNVLSLLVGEYTVIQDVLHVVVGEEWFVVTLLALVAVLSAAYGGTLCSIISDLMQGVVFLLCALAFCVLVAFNWRHNLPRPSLNPVLLGVEKSQLPYSIFSNFWLYVPLYVVTEPLWLRAASAKNSAHLNASMWAGTILGVFIASVYGGLAVLCVWSGKIPEGTPMGEDLFHMFPSEVEKKFASWPNMLMLVIGLSLNRAYADAHHDGLMRLLQPLVPQQYQRRLMPLLLVGINAPLLAIAITLHRNGSNVNLLYVPAGILITSACFPLLLGVVDTERCFIRGFELVVTVATTATATSVYGCAYKGNMYQGLRYSWMESCNSWDVMVVVVASSLLSLGGSVLLRRWWAEQIKDVELGCWDRDCCAEPLQAPSRMWAGLLSLVSWQDPLVPASPLSPLHVISVHKQSFPLVKYSSTRSAHSPSTLSAPANPASPTSPLSRSSVPFTSISPITTDSHESSARYSGV